MRTMRLGEYISATGCTVRSAAQTFGISKSSVHKYVTVYLRELDYELYREVKAVLETNKAQRHLRGGAATRRKYLGL